jgi:hypothetical protein
VKVSEWKPTRKQAAFLSLPYSIKEGFYAGAVGAGKTDVLLFYPILHKFHENQDFKGLFLRRTFPELKNEVIPRSRAIFKAVGGTYNKNDKVWSFPSGALFFFGHCENEDDVHNYDSMQPNYVAFDELTSFTEWQYLYITIERNRSKRASGLPAITRSGSNPGNVGHIWVRRRFIDPCPGGGKIIQGRGGVKRIFIPATIADNPHISSDYANSLEALPEAEKQAKKYGKWDAFEGSVFSEFRDKKYPDEPENAQHVIDRFPIPEWWPKIIVGDWGYAAMTWIGYFAISPDRRVYVYREQTWKLTKVEEWAPYVKRYVDQEKPRIVRFCRSVGKESGQEQTIQQQISNALGVPVELSSHTAGSRVAGKVLFHEYLRWKPAHQIKQELKKYDDEHARWLLRNRGIDEYKSYLDSFTPVAAETNLPKLQIFRDCNEDEVHKEPCELVNAIKACVYSKTRVEDVQEFDGDDPYDGGRYALDAVERFFGEAKQEFQRIQTQELLDAKLKEDGNWTAYYRNSRLIEKRTETVRPIRRFH